MQLLNLCKTLCVALVLLMSAGTFAAEQPNPQTPPPVSININTADAATLAEGLDGVGLARAREIVAYREMHGNFQTVEELADVSGIGMATVEKNRHRIVLEGN
ncbi:MAG: hypothetical protein RLZZ385_771 [Pseudomonadota bacterium]|jgi:competence protein ComEA